MQFSIPSLQAVKPNLCGLMNIQKYPKAVTVVYGLANSFYKIQAFTVRG